MFCDYLKTSQALKNVPLIVQNLIDAINMYDSDSRMSFITPIPWVENTPEKLYLGGPLSYEFTSEYYNDRNEAFGLLFQQYTASTVNKIYYPSIVNEWKSNTNKASYKDKHNLDIYIPIVNT